MKKGYSLTLTGDRHIRVMVGRMREYIPLDFKEKRQVFDAVKYALISKDAFISDEVLTEDLYHELWKWQPEKEGTENE